MSGIEGETAEAVIQGIVFFDFTHWRRLEDGFRGPRLELGIGRGYRLLVEVEVEADPLNRAARYYLLYGDGYQRSIVMARSVRLDEDGLHLEGDGCSAKVPFDASFDARACRDGYAEPKRAIRLYAYDRGEPVRTWALAAKGEPWDSDAPPEPVGFDEAFLDILQDAAVMQRYDGLKVRGFGRGWGRPVGPASFMFDGMEDAPYCSWIDVRVHGGAPGVAEFWINGLLTSVDGDIVIRGDSGAYSIVLENGGRYADADVRYLAENAFDLSGYVGDDMERLENVLDRVRTPDYGWDRGTSSHILQESPDVVRRIRGPEIHDMRIGEGVLHYDTVASEHRDVAAFDQILQLLRRMCELIRRETHHPQDGVLVDVQTHALDIVVGDPLRSHRLLDLIGDAPPAGDLSPARFVGHAVQIERDEGWIVEIVAEQDDVLPDEVPIAPVPPAPGEIREPQELLSGEFHPGRVPHDEHIDVIETVPAVIQHIHSLIGETRSIVTIHTHHPHPA